MEDGERERDVISSFGSQFACPSVREREREGERERDETVLNPSVKPKAEKKK